MSYNTDMANEDSETTLRKDKEWDSIDSELCLTKEFHPIMGSTVKNGEVISPEKNAPYASIVLECRKAPYGITGFVTHKIDFFNLWQAFMERQIDEGEEVVIVWSRKHYKNRISKLLSAASPKMWVIVCRKDMYQEWSTTWPQLLSEKPEAWSSVSSLLESLDEWKPEVIK